MLLRILFLFCVIVLVKADIKSDVDVFNGNYNKNVRNARDLLLRSFDILPSNVSCRYNLLKNLIKL